MTFQPPTGPQPTYPPRRRKRWPWIAGAAAAVFVLLCVGATVGVLTAKKTRTAADAPTTQPAPSTTTAPDPAPVQTIGDGTWTVGDRRGIPPGTYRVTRVADASCHWEIVTPGTGGPDSPSNYGGGWHRVTLNLGERFTTQRCGTWERVG